MRPTASKYVYVRIVALLAFVFILSLLNGNHYAARLNQFTRLSRITATICERNNLSLPVSAISSEHTDNIIINTVSTNYVHVSPLRTYLIMFSTINYTPQQVSDIIKECPA